MPRIFEGKDRVLTDVVIGARTMSSRSNFMLPSGGNASGGNPSDVKTGSDADPVNMFILLASEFSQALPLNSCVNDVV